MDRFFDRLGDVIKSFFDDEDHSVFGDSRSKVRDPDLNAAFEELDDFLNEGKTRGHVREGDDPRARTSHQSDYANSSYWRTQQAKGQIPDIIKRDFAELGLPVGASAELCKAAYKKLLKLHHPDRHAGHSGNMKKATEKSSRINASYQRIEAWRTTGKID